MKIARVLRMLVAGVVLVAGQASATVTYHHNDLLGSPVAATDENRAIVWKESYRPYGERIVNDPASTANSIYFTGRRQDPGSGLVYMGARYYDPVVGRFLSIDPKIFDGREAHGFNRFAYGNNNPYRFVDPDGRDAVEAFAKWWEGSLAGFRSEGVGQTLERALAATPVEAGALGAIGAIKAIGTETRLALKAVENAERIAGDTNKLNHVFGNPKHKLGPLVEQFGSRENAFDAIKSAIEGAVKAKDITGVFEAAVNVGGKDVTVRGLVTDGTVKIGTAFIP